MTEKESRKWLRRQLRPVSWVLVAYFFLMNAMVILTVAYDLLAQAAASLRAGIWDFNPDLDAIMSNGWGYIASIAVGVVILLGWKGGEYFSREIFVRQRPMRAKVFFGALCLLCGSQIINGLWISALEWFLNLFGLSAMAVLESVSGSSDTFSMFLYASILGPISEELLFRGYVLRTLQPFGRRFAVIGSAVLFGIFHGNLLQTPYAFFAGLLLGYIAMEYSVIWAIILHIFNNFLLADVLTRITALLPEMAAVALEFAVLGGLGIIGLVVLIRKRRPLAAYRAENPLDLRALRCFFLNAGFLVLAAIALVNMISLLFV